MVDCRCGWLVFVFAHLCLVFGQICIFILTSVLLVDNVIHLISAVSLTWVIVILLVLISRTAIFSRSNVTIIHVIEAFSSDRRRNWLASRHLLSRGTCQECLRWLLLWFLRFGASQGRVVYVLRVVAHGVISCLN